MPAYLMYAHLIDEYMSVCAYASHVCLCISQSFSLSNAYMYLYTGMYVCDCTPNALDIHRDNCVLKKHWTEATGVLWSKCTHVYAADHCDVRL